MTSSFESKVHAAFKYVDDKPIVLYLRGLPVTFTSVDEVCRYKGIARGTLEHAIDRFNSPHARVKQRRCSHRRRHLFFA